MIRRDMRLEAALTGDLEKYLAGKLRAGEVGITRGVRRTARNLQKGFRGRTRSARLGSKLERAWGRTDYPKSGASLAASSIVFSKARRIHEAFSEGMVIGPKRRRFLIIPLEGAKKIKLDRGLEQSKGNRERKWSQVQAAIARFGSLRWIKIGGGRFLLVADWLTVGSRRSKTRHKGRNVGGEFSPISGRRQSVPLFLVVRQVRIHKRIALKPEIDRAHRQLVPNVLTEWRAAEN